MEQIVRELQTLNRTMEIIRNDIQDIRRNTDSSNRKVTLEEVYDHIPDPVDTGVIEDILDDIRKILSEGKDYSGLGSLEAKIDYLAEQIALHLAKDRV